MSLFDLIDPGQGIEPAPTPGLADLADQGLRSGALDARGKLRRLAGGVMNVAGMDGSNQIAQSVEDQRLAAEAGANLIPFKEVSDVKSGLRWAAGTAGNMAPLGAAAVGAGALTGGRAIPAMLAGTAVQAPVEVGGQLQRQDADPANADLTDAQRLSAAVPAGLGAAAVSNIIPTGVAMRMTGAAGAATKSLTKIGARALADVPANAAAEAGAEGLRQMGDQQANPNAKFNLDAIKDAGIEGAAGGALFGVAGAAGDLAHHSGGALKGLPGRAMDAAAALVPEGAQKRAGEAVDAAQGLGEKAVETAKATDFPSKLRDLYSKTKDRGQDLIDKIAGGKETADLDALNAAGEDLGAQSKVFDEADKTATERVKEWGTDLLNQHLGEEKTAQLTAAMSNLGDGANRQIVANLKRGHDAVNLVREQATKFRDAVATNVDDIKGGAKRSEDFSGVRAKIGEAVTGALGEDHPAFGDAQSINTLADGLRPFIEQVAAGKVFNSFDKLDQLTALHDVLGDKTTAVLKAVHDAVGAAGRDKEEFFSALNQIDAIQKGRMTIMEAQMKNLRPELQNAVRPSELRAEADVLSKWARSKTRDSGSAEQTFTDAQVKAALQHRYGPKADVVLAAIEKNMKVEQNVIDLANTSERTTEDGLATVKHYAQNNQLYLNPELDKGKGGFEGAAAQRMKTAQKNDPQATVSFRKASELGLDDPMVKSKHADLVDEGMAAGLTEAEAKARADKEIDKFGVVTAESTKQETALTSGDLKAVSLDAKHHGTSKSRVDAGEGVIIDAVKLTEFMNKKLSTRDDYIDTDNLSTQHRAARMFKEGMAAAMERLGRSFEIPDTTKITRAGLTWGEAKKLDNATAKDRASDAVTKEINELRQKYREATSPRERKEIADRGKELAGEKQWEVIREQASEGRNTDDTVDSGRAAPDPFGNVHEALKGGDDPAAVIRTNSGGEPRNDTVMGRRKPATSVEGSPDPKERAAKQAAFLEKARSGDETLTKELAHSNDAKGLQRAVEALAKEKATLEIQAVVDTINGRLSELVAQPGVAYGMQTKKYSLITTEGLDAREVSYDDFLANNGSGESAASQEAVNRRDQERARGQARIRVDKYGNASPLFLSVDTRAQPGEVIMQRGVGRDEWTVLSSGDGVNASATARAQNAAKSFDLTRARYDKTTANPANSSTSSVKADVEAHIQKVLGTSVATEWANILHAGEFDRTKTADIIRLSVHALNPMSVAYHESLHGFFAKLRDAKQGDIAGVLEKAGSSAPVLNQLKKLLANEPGALSQLTDPEERAAYMYQFWAQGKLTVGPQVQTVFQRIAEFIRKAVGLWSNDQRAEAIMDYFHSGDFQQGRSDLNAVRRATMEPGNPKALHQLKAMTESVREMGETLASAGGERLRDTGIPALRELANAMKLKGTNEGSDTGYLPAARAERARRMNDLMADLKPYKEDVINEALEGMQQGVKPASLAARTVAAMVHKRLGDALTYMKDAGVRIDDLGMKDGTKYFPRAWDASYISGHQKQFLAMVDKYVASGEYKGDPKKLMQKLMVTDGAEFNVEVDKPGMQNAKERVLSFIKHEDAAPFMRKNLHEIMNNYMTQATRRAEWARRFADDGSGIKSLMARAEKEGATPQQLETAQKFVRSVDGTLGDTINPTARRLMGNMIVYQNLRLLPLAIFSSVVDAQGIVVRGGTAKEAFSTFTRGIKETVKNFKKDPASDDMTRLAETLGVIDSATLVHTLGASYSQGMVGNKGRQINDAFFRLNLMEQFNTSMRVGATEAAMNFMVRHATEPGQHSARFLGELGLTAKDVQVDALGRPKLQESDGLTPEHAAKMKAAVNRWVDGAVLRPDAVDKPIWMSDPHYALVAHLKQFVFSFHETILKRVVHEAKEGNYTPAMALASYVPMMIAADYLKGLIQGGGEEPSWKKGWGAEDYVWSGMERAGLFGVGQFGLDAYQDVKRGGAGFGALTGPTVEQFTEALKVMGGAEHFKTFGVKALPANALYASALKSDATDPKFDE